MEGFVVLGCGSIGVLLALISLIVCASRGYVMRGLASGALILLLWAAQYVLPILVLAGGSRSDQPEATLGTSVAVGVGCFVAQFVVMAIAISRQAGAPVDHVKKARLRRQIRDR